MITKRRHALISVFDKKNLFSLCNEFKKQKIELISTGSTGKYIKKLGFKCKLISDLTKFKEMLGGRVKTLHSNIYVSILHNRSKKQDVKSFSDLNFPKIDFLVVNLYPFKKIIKKNNNFQECIEMIDVGGPSLLRAAAKNFEYITTLCDVKDYKIFIENLRLNQGKTTIDFRKRLASKVFFTTSEYDKTIYNWFDIKQNPINIELKYGENPNQKSKLYLNSNLNSFFKNKIQGKDLGYNNILDLDAGLNSINEFSEPTCVIIKHNNPCGVASDKSINIAFKKSLQSDPMSAFGGIVILNKSVNKQLAKKINENFFEIIAAKKFYKDSLEILSKKKNLILIETKNLLQDNKDDVKSVIGGYLTQEKNTHKIKKSDLQCVSKKKTNLKNFNDLLFAFKVCKHVKSNAIVLVNNKQTIGIGAGQMSRLDATKLAINKINKNNKNKKFIAASDAFFPFTDSIKILIKNKCTSIVQPKGSINDKKIIEFANKYKLALYFTKYRLFKH